MAWPYGRQWAALVKARVGDGTAVCEIGLPGCTIVAETLDHHPVTVQQIKAQRPELDHLALDPSNLRPACRGCNVRKEMARRRRTPGWRRPNSRPRRRRVKRLQRW